MFNVTVVKNTACIMLEKDNTLIDCTFINKFHFDNFMTDTELMKDIRDITSRNNVTDQYNVNWI